MAEETQSEGLDPAILEKVAEAFASAGSEDLRTLLGDEIEIRGPIVEPVSPEEAAALPGEVVQVVCATSEDPPRAVHLVFRRSDAAALAALQMGEDPAAAAAATDPLDEPTLEALGNVSKLATALLGRLLDEHLGAGGVEIQDTRQIDEPGADPSWLGTAQLARMSFDLVIGDLPKGHLEILVPEEAGESACGAVGEPPAALVVLELDEDERTRLEGLEGELGRPLHAMNPLDLLGGELGPIPSAAAVVVPWDFAGRAGLELVEELAWSDETQDVPILMSSPAPTRGMVLAALRSGARGFVHQPYEAEELTRRALAASGSPPASDTQDCPPGEEK